MTAQHVKFVTSQVITNEPLELYPDPDNPVTPMPLLPVAQAQMDLTEQAVSDKEFDFDVPPSQVRREIARLATACLENPALPTDLFMPFPSRPSGPKWEPTMQIYLHPMSSAGEVCVVQGGGSSTQLSLHAQLSPGKIP
jgi:hypothetical protein